MIGLAPEISLVTKVTDITGSEEHSGSLIYHDTKRRDN